MATIDAVATPPLTTDQMDAILRSPNGPHLIMQFCRDGRIDPELAARAIDRFEDTPRQVARRALAAMVGAVLGR